MTDTSTPKGSMCPIPTVAEVREEIDTHGLCDCGSTLTRTDGSKYHYSGCDVDDALRALVARLDPDTQFIVTVESLAEALWYLGIGCGECSGTRTSETDAGRIMRHLRGEK